VFLAKVISIFAVYLFHLYISNKYGASVNGVFTLFVTILTIVSVISKLGFDTSVVKYMSSFNTQGQLFTAKSLHKKTSLMIFIVAVILSLLLWWFNEFLNQLFFNESSFIDFRWMALALPFFSLLSINTESLRGLERTKSYSFLQNGTLFLISLMLVYAFSTTVTDVTFLVLASFCASIFALYIVSVFLLNSSFKNANKAQEISLKPYIRESLPMLLSNSVFFLMTWADIIIISYFLPESETGIYGNAAKIANLNIVFLFAINAIAAPKLAAFNANKDMLSLKKFTKETSRISLLLSLPIFIAIVLFPEFLLGMFGAEFATGKHALIILAVGQLFNAMSGSVINVLNMADKQIVAKNIILISAILNVILNIVLIPLYGIMGAAIATATSTILWNGLAVGYIYKHFKFISITLPWQKN